MLIFDASRAASFASEDNVGDSDAVFENIARFRKIVLRARLQAMDITAGVVHVVVISLFLQQSEVVGSSILQYGEGWSLTGTMRIPR